jgi:hypothetical protein
MGFRNQRSDNNVIASGAKQSSQAGGNPPPVTCFLDCFVACAPRKDAGFFFALYAFYAVNFFSSLIPNL